MSEEQKAPEAAPQLPAQQHRELSDDEALRAILSVRDVQGRIALTYESGPYSVTSLTHVGRQLVRAIERAVAAPPAPAQHPAQQQVRERIILLCELFADDQADHFNAELDRFVAGLVAPPVPAQPDAERMTTDECIAAALDAYYGLEVGTAPWLPVTMQSMRAAMRAAIRAAMQQKPAQLVGQTNPWRDAVDEARAIAGLDITGPDAAPDVALRELTAWVQQIALDPLVSSEAQALIDRGRDDAAAIVRQLAAALKTASGYTGSLPEYHMDHSEVTQAIADAKAWLEGK